MTVRNLRLPSKPWLSGLCAIDDELNPEADGGAGDGPSLHEALTAAFAEDAKAQEAAPGIVAPEPQIAASDADARARDNQGRFTKPPEQASSTTIEPKTPQASAEPSAVQQGQQATIGPPPSWSATAKADWTKLPEHIQREVLKREGDIQAGKAQWDQKAERLNRLDAVLSPHRERFQMAGVEEAQAIQALLAAQGLLERSPTDGIAYLARQYGVDLRQYAQRAAGQQPPQGAQPIPPQLQHLASEVQTLKSTLAQQQQSAEQATRAGYLDQVQQFSADPANVYFENVRDVMGRLLKSGAAADLKDAYDKACWADPEIRTLLLRQQDEQRTAQARNSASAKATAARHASGSITGSPAPGATPVNAGGQGSTVREALEAAFREHAA